MINKIKALIHQKPIALLLIYAIAVRLIFVCFYGAITLTPDSYDYLALADTITNFDWSNYDGKRTPGFPIFISLFGGNLTVLIGFQIILGVLTTVLLFNITRHITKTTNLAFWTAIIYTSFVNVVLFDFAVLTENISAFVLLLTIWHIIKSNLFNHQASIKHYILLSLLFGWLYMIRPFFIYIPVGFALFFIVKQFKTDLKYSLIKSLITLSVPLLSYVLWNNYNLKTIGHFTNTQYFGINLAQTATPFFEKAVTNDTLIKTILVKHRDSLKQYNPDRIAMSVWFAHQELLDKTKLTEVELSHRLSLISKDLFKKHPELYLKQVGISWLLFWGNKSSFYWNNTKVKNSYFRLGIIATWLYLQRYLLLIINVFFIIFSFKKIYLFFKNKCTNYDVNLFIICIVLSASLAQALVAFGNNSRFCYPYFALIVYFVMLNLNNRLKKIKI